MLMPGVMEGPRPGVLRLLIPIPGFCILVQAILRHKWKALRGPEIISTAAHYWHLMRRVVITGGIINRCRMIAGAMMSPVHRYYLILRLKDSLFRRLVRQEKPAGFMCMTDVTVSFSIKATLLSRRKICFHCPVQRALLFIPA